jgi:hypothetical protein
MRCLSAIRNAIVVCLSGGRCHSEKRKREQRRSGGCELFRGRSHFVFFFLFTGPIENSSARDPRRVHGGALKRRAGSGNCGHPHRSHSQIFFQVWVFKL